MTKTINWSTWDESKIEKNSNHLRDDLAKVMKLQNESDRVIMSVNHAYRVSTFKYHCSELQKIVSAFHVKRAKSHRRKSLSVKLEESWANILCTNAQFFFCPLQITMHFHVIYEVLHSELMERERQLCLMQMMHSYEMKMKIFKFKNEWDTKMFIMMMLQKDPVLLKKALVTFRKL